MSSLRLNLACGVNLKDGWVNVDLYREGVDVERVDLTQPWPWADESAEVVYCEHFLEHLEFPGEVHHFLDEAWRVLEDQGVLHIGVPDCGRLFHWYASTWSTPNFDHPMNVEVSKWGGKWPHQMDRVQKMLRENGEHKWGYDETSLRGWLRFHQFVDVRRDWNADMDSKVRKDGTLYVVGRKEKWR